MIDIRIINGLVYDPYLDSKEVRTVCIKDGIIVEDDGQDAKQTIDAKDCMVLPGLIEGHAHVFHKAVSACIPVDPIMLPGGATTSIDAGTAGYGNFDLFYKEVVCNAVSNVKAYLNFVPGGLLNEAGKENINPKYFNKEKLKACIDKYPETIVGLKLRISKDLCDGYGVEPLDKALQIAEELKLPLALHVMDPPCPVEEIARKLRKGDIWIHCFQQKGEKIFDENGRLNPEVKKAQERGVLFDPSGGRSAFSIPDIKSALNQGFIVDLLSTDQVNLNVYEPPLLSLLYTMSMYVNCGYDLYDVIKMATINIAKVLKQEKQLASLMPNTVGDVCIIKNKQRATPYFDKYGNSFTGNTLLIPQLTLKDGKVVFRNIEFI